GEGLPLNWAQPASTSRMSAPRSRGPSQRRTPRLASGERSSRLRRLANGVIPTWAPGMAAGDPPDAHPAALQSSVFLDRLLRVARATRLIAAAGGQPREQDPAEPDESDP